MWRGTSCKGRVVARRRTRAPVRRAHRACSRPTPSIWPWHGRQGSHRTFRYRYSRPMCLARNASGQRSSQYSTCATGCSRRCAGLTARRRTMQAERHGGPGGMAAWLEERERQLRALEAENRELRRQLDELRRQLVELRHGIGIALLIEGRLVPLAPTAVVRGPTGPTPATSFASPAAPPAPHLWPPHLAPASDPQHAAGQAPPPLPPLA